VSFRVILEKGEKFATGAILEFMATQITKGLGEATTLLEGDGQVTRSGDEKGDLCATDSWQCLEAFKTLQLDYSKSPGYQSGTWTPSLEAAQPFLVDLIAMVSSAFEIKIHSLRGSGVCAVPRAAVDGCARYVDLKKWLEPLINVNKMRTIEASETHCVKRIETIAESSKGADLQLFQEMYKKYSTMQKGRIYSSFGVGGGCRHTADPVHHGPSALHHRLLRQAHPVPQARAGVEVHEAGCASVSAGRGIAHIIYCA